MKYIIIITIAFLQISIINAQNKKKKTDANIFGHVICINCDEHLSFATISIKGTTIGTTTDETGHYQLINLPEGNHTIKASYIGYKSVEKQVTIKKGESKEINFELEKDLLGFDEVVVTADRNETNRKEASIIVSTITPKIFEQTQSVTLSEGLNFCPGLRMENNCQNCGFSQVRMNGMEGPYSQILINSRPIFSGLAGVYGLELIPTNMIERIEIIRGGGSALYGGNAIAGTINLILKDPIKNTYEMGLNNALIGLDNKYKKIANDFSANFNTSLVSVDSKTGLALYSFFRERNPFDANNDDFSEISLLKNITFGSRFYHRLGIKNKISADFFTIKENRRGGDKFDYMPHEANIAEQTDHLITTGAITYDHFFRDNDLFSVFVSGQRIIRDSYYGANQSLCDYGNTQNFTMSAGAQYNAKLNKTNMVFGIENNSEWLLDKKLGYLDIENTVISNDTIQSISHIKNTIVADQAINTLGVFAQIDRTIQNFKLSAGLRYDNYAILDKQHAQATVKNDVLSPRFTIKYDVSPYFQIRSSYSQGYRAPQIFDEDLHIETSGSRKIIHQNSPDLKQETSNSVMLSFDFNKKIKNTYMGILVEGFYTQLNNPFANKYSEPDSNGIVVYTRVNAEKGAIVKGVNLEANLKPSENITIQTGFTIQNSIYQEAQEFNEKKFFRTPDNYGFLTFDWKLTHNFGFSVTGNYTGKMLIPYFGLQIANPDNGELWQSDSFTDFGAKIRYSIKLNGARMQFTGGIKNILNSYQNDFDIGIDRDPAYIYGPSLPRTIYFGIKIGNFIK